MRVSSLIAGLLGLLASACSSYDSGRSPAADDGAPDVGSDAGVGDGAIPSLDAADTSTPGSTSSAFTHVGSGREDCPYASGNCEAWPSALAGVVTKHTSRETFRGKVIERTFHVFVPRTRGNAPLPVVMVLHGGFGSGGRMVGTSRWPTLAAAPAAGLPWRPNVATCRARAVTLEAPELTYTNGTADCEPPVATPVSDRPFIAVFPDGVADPGKDDLRHWEDGRLPSPGFETTEPNRDDVAFLDHVLDVVIREGKAAADQTYITGLSNGGMMTQRLAIEMSAHPRLAAVAAFVSFVANLPKPIAAVPPAKIPHAFALFVGTDIPTKTCGVGEGAASCSSPVVPGDGRVPFGQLGDVFEDVVSGPDTISNLRRSLGIETASSRDAVGYFTEREAVTYQSGAAFQAWVTRGGGHSAMSSRQDFSPQLQAWAFMSRFRRAASGELERQTPATITGRY